MKKILKQFFLLLGSAVLITSCNKKFLDTQPLDKAAAGPTWSDPALSEAFVTDIYNVLHDGILNQESMDCISDNCLYNFGRADIMESNISPGSTGWVNNTYEWGEMYKRIRAANLALENLATAPFDKTMVDRLKGESYFLRAYCYNQMLRYYGAVPIIKSSYALSTPDFSIARNTYDECVKAIVSDLDSSKLLLTGKTLAAGRATPAADRVPPGRARPRPQPSLGCRALPTALCCRPRRSAGAPERLACRQLSARSIAGASMKSKAVLEAANRSNQLSSIDPFLPSPPQN